MPIGRGLMQIERQVKGTLTVTSSGYFCNLDTFDLTATIPGATGTITFVLWTNNIDSTSYGPATLSGGAVSYPLSEGTLEDNTTYYVQAVYSGDGNHVPSSTPAGTAGTTINPITEDVTSVALPYITDYTPVGIGSNEFCVFNNITLNAVVSSTHLTNPSDGSVVFRVAYSEESPVILPGVTPVGGVASFTFNAQDYFYYGLGGYGISAEYVSSDPCYASAGYSSVLTVNAQLNSVALSISGTSAFCYADDSSYSVNVSSSVSGTIYGTVTLMSNLQGTLGTVTGSWPSNGSESASFSFPGFTWSSSHTGFQGLTATFASANALTSSAITLPVSTVPVYTTAGFTSSGTISVDGQAVTYTGITGTSFTGCSGGSGAIPIDSGVTPNGYTGCYGTHTSNTYDVTVSSSSTQSPALMMLAPNVTSGSSPPDQSSTIQFTASLDTTGMTGTINDGSQYISFYAYSDSNPDPPDSPLLFATATVTTAAGGVAYYYASFTPANASTLGGAGQNFYFFCDFEPGNSCFAGNIGSTCDSGSGSYYECGTGENLDTVQVYITETPH